MSEVTRLLERIAEGESSSDELLPLVYRELQELARSRLKRESAGQTLQATDLVHEAYLRLVKDEEASWENRGHFFAAAAEAMRRILIERARRRKSEKHGGELNRLELQNELFASEPSPDRILAIDEALEKLADEDPVAAEVVKIKAFGGLSMEQTAQALNISRPTAYRHFSYARAWLLKEVSS